MFAMDTAVPELAVAVTVPEQCAAELPEQVKLVQAKAEHESSDLPDTVVDVVEVRVVHLSSLRPSTWTVVELAVTVFVLNNFDAVNPTDDAETAPVAEITDEVEDNAPVQVRPARLTLQLSVNVAELLMLNEAANRAVDDPLKLMLVMFVGAPEKKTWLPLDTLRELLFRFATPPVRSNFDLSVVMEVQDTAPLQ